MTQAPQDGEVADIYRDKYVAFVDLLGFKQCVVDADKHPGRRRQLLQMLALVKETLCENPSIGMCLTHFSDCIIVSADRTPKGLFEMLASLDTLTFNLLQHDVPVRGGLAAGGAHHDGNFVYGVAVNDAYSLEQCAKYPMILVADAVLSDAKANGPQFENWLGYDVDGRPFVHYLRQYAEYDPKVIFAGKVVLDEPAVRTMDFICHRLNTHSGTVLEKAHWFRDYWNRTVAPSGVFGRIEAGVTERVATSGPTIIVRRMFVPG